MTKPLPDIATEADAVAAARTRASSDPSRRFRLIELLPDGAQPRFIWDSHPAC